jgi:pyruvate dehydrogenase E2 component (dihydrolipoamide acetyltransferase)
MAAITVNSKSTIPHFYVTVDVDVSKAIAWREQWNQAHSSLPASFNDIFVKAASLSLSESPQVNVAFKEGSYEQKSSGDVLLVVATDGRLSLIPIQDPSVISWEEHLGRMKTTLDAARQGKVSGQGVTAPLLAISNLGMFGVREFAAIIPPGCTAVLAIGSIRDQVVLNDGQLETGKICSLTLSADHRVMDGVAAAKFLERIQVHLNSL